MATPIIQILVSISLSLVAIFALGSSLGISLDAETFVAFFTASGLMAKPIRQLSSVNGIIQKGLAANEIFDQLDYEDEKIVEKLLLRYKERLILRMYLFPIQRDKKVLNDINISIHPLGNSQLLLENLVLGSLLLQI